MAGESDFIKDGVIEGTDKNVIILTICSCTISDLFNKGFRKATSKIQNNVKILNMLKLSLSISKLLV